MPGGGRLLCSDLCSFPCAHVNRGCRPDALKYFRARLLTRFFLSQLLEYQACKAEGDADCQFYKRHHDYIDTDREMNQVECE